MQTLQTLRQRAQAAGTLGSDDRYRVLSEGDAIAILPANPQIVYVPYYANPPVYYSEPVVSVGVGYRWAPHRTVYVGHGRSYRHW